jgi:hypothetical protein
MQRLMIHCVNSFLLVVIPAKMRLVGHVRRIASSECGAPNPMRGASVSRLTADRLPCIVGSAMTTAVFNNFIPTRAVADSVIHPRGRRMFWEVAGKYDATGRQKGPI